MKLATYPHHLGHFALLRSPASVREAQQDAAAWHGTARHNVDAYGDDWARLNAKTCQTYTARVSKAVRFAMGIEE